MTKYPLEWGWEQAPHNSSGAPAETPRETLLGRMGNGDVQVAAAGDLRCEVCPRGGSWGTTGSYVIGRTVMCRECAVKRLGIEELPGSEQNEYLKNFELQSR